MTNNRTPDVYPSHTRAISSKSYKNINKDSTPNKELFVKGPLPLWWLIRASKGRGSTLLFGLYIFMQQGLRKNSSFHINITSAAKALQLSRWSALRAFENLIKLGLVKADRKKGRKAFITINNEQTNEMA